MVQRKLHGGSGHYMVTADTWMPKTVATEVDESTTARSAEN